MAHPRLELLSSLTKIASVSVLCASAALFTSARPAHAGDTGSGTTAAVSIKVLNSRAPPGGVVQFLVTLTEPKPILTGIMSLAYDPVGPVLGVSLFSPGAAASDACGTAVVRGGQVTVRTTSPSAQLGTAAGVPILTLSIGVPPDVPLGTRGMLAIDPAASLWVDPAGNPYVQQIKNGSFEIASTLSITDVFPGGGLLPAGSAVVVRGVGFQPGAIVEIDGVPVATTAFVSDREVDATIAADADLYGRVVTVKNPDLSQARYYAYLRGTWLAPTSRPLLAATDPIFSPQTFTSVWFVNTAAAGQFLGLALQNPAPGSAEVAVELRSSTAALVASAALSLPPRTRISREVSEVFGTAAPAGGFLVIRSAVPVQVLGVVGDEAAGAVVPQTPALAFP